MLSLTRGKPIAFVLKKGKDGKYTKTQTIRFRTADWDEEPDIDVDDRNDVLSNDDLKEIFTEYRLNKFQQKQILRAMQKNDDEKEELSIMRKVKKEINNRINNKLKKQLRFDKGSMIIPALNEKDFNYSYYANGASGSGKSFIISKIIENDPHPDRKVFLFSRLLSQDPSLQELYNSGKLKKIDTSEPDEFPQFDELENSIVIYDDIASDRNAEAIRQHQNDALCCGRHRNICVFSTNHLCSEYSKTRNILNEAKWVIGFPASNKYSVSQFMKERLAMKSDERKKWLKMCNQDNSRYLCFLVQYPNILLTSRSIVLLN